MPLHSINAEQRLFVMRSGEGFTCLGFDVATRRRDAVLRWLDETGGDRPETLDLREAWRTGTADAFTFYERTMAKGAQHNRLTGKRCPAELTAELVGLEGRRVEVAEPSGERRRFKVGKSCGWMPCHLELANERSSGGPAVYFPDGATVRVIR